MLVDLGYMGNHSVKLVDSAQVRMNQTPASVIDKYGSLLNRTITSAADAAALGVPYPYPGFRGTVNSALRDFPQIRSNDTVGNQRRAGSVRPLRRDDADRESPVYARYRPVRELGLVENDVQLRQHAGLLQSGDYESIDANDTPMW